MVAPVLLSLMIAALQTSIVFYVDQVLQTLTTEVARNVMVGTAQSSGLTQSQFSSQVCTMAPSIFQSTSGSSPVCNGLMIDVESSSDYSSLNTSALSPTYDVHGQVTNTWSYDPGGPGSIVIVRLMYDWPIIGGPLGIGLANQSNGTHLLVGTAVVKNEPYS